MWLINAHSLRLEDFSAKPAPLYAILSHTWGPNETSFAQMREHANNATSVHDHKITETCRLALAHGLEYAWIDTCAIDKSSSAELSEAINSMFRWYQEAAVCFVYLSDVPSTMEIDPAIASCRWRTRGWTLQELIAPKNIEFYDSVWQLRGHKHTLTAILAQHTGVPEDLLSGNKPLGFYAVASKMSWASARETTRVEDTAYCLLGVFDINMPLLYGEGSKAFQRLQEEIIRKDADLSIFAWNPPEQPAFPLLNLFASSPTAFSGLDSSSRADIDDLVEVSITQRGLTIRGSVGICKEHVNGNAGAPLPVLWSLPFTYSLGLPLRQITDGLFARGARNSPLQGFPFEYERQRLSGLTIVTRPADITILRARDARRLGTYIPADILPGFSMQEAYPAFAWALEDNVILCTNPRDRPVLAIKLQNRNQDLVILMVPQGRGERRYYRNCRIYGFCYDGQHNTRDEDHKEHAHLYEEFEHFLFGDQANQRLLYWDDLTKRFPHIAGLKTEVVIHETDRERNVEMSYLISASLDLKGTNIDVFGQDVSVRTLKLEKTFLSSTHIYERTNGSSIPSVKSDHLWSLDL